MDITDIENLTLGELKELFKLNNLSIKQALPEMRKFRDKHGYDDKTALRAFGIAKRVFG